MTGFGVCVYIDICVVVVVVVVVVAVVCVCVCKSNLAAKDLIYLKFVVMEK